MKYKFSKLVIVLILTITSILLTACNNESLQNEIRNDTETNNVKTQAESDAEKAVSIVIGEIKKKLVNPYSMKIVEDINVVNAEIVDITFSAENNFGGNVVGKAHALVDIEEGTCSFYIENQGDDLVNAIINQSIQRRLTEIVELRLEDIDKGIVDTYPNILIKKELFD